eukprot:m.87352 g.87352  ORF g.87352 m.87352 type:complete len:725 (+) comp16399_c1_seq1:238-2412(+)
MSHASARPHTRQDLLTSRPGEARPTEESKRLVLPKYRPFERCRDLANYQRLDKVGQGTFGEVFKARSKDPPYEIVALKKVLMKNESEGFPITALREIKILMLMRHPNVLTLIEIAQTPATEFNRQTGSIFLVFEYMDHDLGGLLNRGVEFTAPEVMCIAHQILDGTHYVHTQKILHRDMKAANILMNNKGIVKIADFGLARGECKSSRYTAVVCTRWYRPPELLLGERHYTTAVDIWGVGCIVAELFIGRPILQGGRHDARDESENDLDQFLKICELCGTPSEAIWEGYDKLPFGRFVLPTVAYHRTLETYFEDKVRGIKSAISFIGSLLTLDPKKRPSASEALNHVFFWGGEIVNGKETDPRPCKPAEIRQFQSSHEFTMQRRIPMKPAGVKAVRVEHAHPHRHAAGAPPPRPTHTAPAARDRAYAAPTKQIPSAHQPATHHHIQPQLHGGQHPRHQAPGSKPHVPGGQPGGGSHAKPGHRGGSVTTGRGRGRGGAHPHGGYTHQPGPAPAGSHTHASHTGHTHTSGGAPASNLYTTPQQPAQARGSPHSGSTHTQRNRPSVWASSTTQPAAHARHPHQQQPPHESRRFNPGQHHASGRGSRHAPHQGRPSSAGLPRTGRTPTHHGHAYSPSTQHNTGHSPLPGANDAKGRTPRGTGVSGDDRISAHHTGKPESVKRGRSGDHYGYGAHEPSSKRSNVTSNAHNASSGAHVASSTGGASGDYH